MPTTTDWFRRKRATSSTDPKAAYRRLVRMLAGDAERRTRAPVTLPGRHVGNGIIHECAPSSGVEISTPPPDERPRRTGHISRGYGSRAVRGGAEPLPEDATGPYAREELERMDQDFIAAVERAFQNGGEHRQSAAMNGATGSRSR